MGVFCSGYNELAFLCNGTDWHEIREKNVNRCHVLNLNRNSENLSLRVKPAFLGCFDGSPCHRPTGQRLGFSTYLSLPSVRKRAMQRCAQISLSEP